jgi:cellulose synthase/poly-beta-1,6-N-acetylglucosamine synthase-like glycosyltransferase
VGIVSGYAPRGVRLFHRPERRGKAAAINRVVPLTSGEILVFSDANTLIETGAIRALVRSFADPRVGGVSGEKQVQGGGEGLYWRYESFLKRCDSALSSVMGAAGEFFAVRHDLFQPTEEDSLIEDFVLSLRLVQAGWRVVYESEAVASEEASPSLAGDWRRRVRIAAGGFQAIVRLRGLLTEAGGLVVWQYCSHRVLRWAVTPFLLPVVYVLSALLAAGSPFYRLLLLAQTAFYAAALVGYALTRLGLWCGPLHAVFYFCFANAAAVAGFWRYVTKTQPVTWAKAR